MAKKITKQEPAAPSFFDAPPKKLERDPNVASKWDISEKQEPDIVFSERDWDAPGKMGVLPKGSRFVECNDGFYNIYLPGGDRAHYRVARKVIHGVINEN